MKATWKIFALSAAYVGLPPLAYLLRYKVVAPMYLFAGDAFYYLDIARHSSGSRGFSFDGEHATNGFHPLWEYLLLGLSRMHLVDYGQSSAALVPVFILNLLLLTLGSAILCVAGSRFLRAPLLSLLVVAPGLLWFAAAPINPTYLASWTFLNGMESASALLCFACALLLAHERPLAFWRISLVSCCLGLGVLARLDDIFIAVPIAAFLVWRTNAARRLEGLLASFLPLFALLLAYLFYNRSSVGVFLPISGATKAGFAFGANLKWTARLFLPVITGDGPTVLMTRRTAYFGYGELGGRLAQMLLPLIICVAELWFVTRRRNVVERINVLHACAFGVLLKAFYNFAFVQAWAQGPWYYAVSCAVANLVLLLWLDRLIYILTKRRDLLGLNVAILGGHTLLALAAFNVFISHKNEDGPVNEVRLLARNQPVREKLKSLRAARVLEFDDGFTSYVAQVPSAAGLGLALDAEGASAVRSGTFLDLIYRRGYRIAVANGAYADQIDDALQAQQAGAHPRIAELHTSELDHYFFRPLGGDGSDDLLKYYQIVPRESVAREEPQSSP